MRAAVLRGITVAASSRAGQTKPWSELRTVHGTRPPASMRPAHSEGNAREAAVMAGSSVSAKNDVARSDDGWTKCAAQAGEPTPHRALPELLRRAI